MFNKFIREYDNLNITVKVRDGYVRYCKVLFGLVRRGK